ncbi:MAG: CBS domain-containing protein, partial [Deferribacterales bacterium]
PIVIPENMKFNEIVPFISKTKHNNFPVIRENGTFAGVLLFEELREFVLEEGLEDIVVAGEVCETDVPAVSPDDSLSDAIENIGFKKTEMLPVVDPENPDKLLGIITRKDIISTYNKIIRRRQQAEQEKAIDNF